MVRKLKTILILVFVISSYEHCIAHELEVYAEDGTRITYYESEMERAITLPKGYHEGLFLDKENIWVANGEEGKVWVIDIVSGEILSEILPVAKFTENITKGPGDSLWSTDWDSKKLYKIKLQGDKMKSVFEVPLAPAHPAGITSDGKHLFLITWTRGIGTKYHILKMDTEGNILSRVRIKNIPEPSQLTWDGEYLWVSSWFNRRVYKIDENTFDVIGYFRSKIKETTGIAWDGEAFWVTGTKADLYRIKLLPRSGK